MKKILFLDIDGVLAGFNWLKNRKNGGDFLDPELVQKLNILDYDIVISSSCGCDDGLTEKKLRQKGLKLPIIGYTEHFEIGYDWIVRGNSIKKWLCDNMGNTNFQYVIVDDDSDMLLEQKEHFVQTNIETGITDENIKKISQILNSDIL